MHTDKHTKWRKGAGRAGILRRHNYTTFMEEWIYINHNSMATAVSNNLTSHYASLQTSTQRLSSGLRINKAADDAAGLAVRELMRADIAALNQGIRNANDGISLIQTADGALGVIDNNLIRLKELAEQSATGTYDSTQRALINEEYQQVCSEITRIATATDFNGLKLLNGQCDADWDAQKAEKKQPTDKSAIRIHFGTGNDSAEDFFDIRIGTCTASALGVGNAVTGAGKSIESQEKAGNALVAIQNAIVSKDKIRATLGAMSNRLEATVSNLTTQAENLQAAESRISDADIATEMTQFVRNQILAQSSVAMLSQANQMPQMALSLIR